MTPLMVMATLALGGFGAVVRFAVKETLAKNGDHRLAVALVNIVGSGLAGGVAALPESALSQIIIVGFAGALTTFSTIAVQLATKKPSVPWWSHAVVALVHSVGAIGACVLAFHVVALTWPAG